MKRVGGLVESRDLFFKNDFSEGGLNITDVECLNKALKLRQFIGADASNQPIKRIHLFCHEELGDISIWP